MPFSHAARVLLSAATACMVMAASARAESGLDVLHAFAGNPGTPAGRLTQGGDGRLYGAVTQAGRLAAGAIFAAELLPTGALAVTSLHVFNGTDGRWPSSGLIQANDGAFYGTTVAGGLADRGTVFKVTAEGQFTLLHSFDGADGASPAALVETSDGSFYGTTVRGGEANLGTIFRIAPNGSFGRIYSFTCADGAQPIGALIQATDGNFYGTTYGTTSESCSLGTVFRMTPAGSVETLHRFTSPGAASPVAGLTQGQDGALYGTTLLAGFGINLASALFRITTAGEFTVVYNFAEFGTFGSTGGVIQGSDGAFYGTTIDQGAEPLGMGKVFRVTADGHYTALHQFSGGDGRQPYSGVIQASDGRLYGMTTFGGVADHGVIYAVTTDGDFTSLGSFSSMDGEAPSGGVIRGTDGNFYGTTARGGPVNKGTVFRMTPTGELTQLHVFSGPDGAVPLAGLVQADDGHFYGVTSEDGANNGGTVFRVTSTGLFQTLHALGPGGDAQWPLVKARDGSLYGADRNFIFRVTTAGDFSGIGTVPTDISGPLIEASDGNLYGTSSGYQVIEGCGPISFDRCVWTTGAVFRVTPGVGVSVLMQFSCVQVFIAECRVGTDPTGGLVQANDGFLYGIASDRVFRISTSGEFSTVSSLQGGERFRFRTGFIRTADGHLYGTDGSGVYSLSTTGEIALVHSFEPYGVGLDSRLLETEPGVFYGTGSVGGPASHGVVARLTLR